MLPFATITGETKPSGKPSALSSLRRAQTEARRLPLIPILFLLLVFICAVFSPFIAPHDPYDFEAKDRLLPPCWEQGGDTRYILGTDGTGRDILSRIIYGARISLIVAAIAVTASLAIGTIIGIISGYFGGWLDMFLMRLVDIVMSMPFLFLALALAAVIPPGIQSVILIIVVLGWAGFARLVRGEVLSLKERDFVALARVAQASPWRIAVKHILPGLVNTLTVLATLDVGAVILFEAALSFIGIGIQPPTPSWGAMISEGRNYISTAWWLTTFPGIVLMLMVFSTNFVGDWLRDALDPKLRQLR